MKKELTREEFEEGLGEIEIRLQIPKEEIIMMLERVREKRDKKGGEKKY